MERRDEDQVGIDTSISDSELSEKIIKIDNNLKALTKLLFDNPEAAIKIPLLIKEIDALKMEVTIVREQIRENSSNFKWMFGIIITPGISVLAIVISVLTKS